MLRNKVRYLLFLLSLGLISILYNQYYMGIILLTVIAIPFLLFGLLCFIYGNIRAELLSVVHVVNKEEAIPITILLNNPTIFPVANLKIYLSYKNAYSGQRFKKTFTVSLDGRTKTTIVCNLYSEYAGNLEISLKGVRIYDYLKLFSLKKRLSGELKVAVLPYYYELPDSGMVIRDSSIIESDSFSTVRSGDDPSEVFAIREYREGDRPQRIHWKLSRKQNQLMIKEFSDPLNSSVLLFANLGVSQGENTLRVMDCLLECALSLSFSFICKGQMHYFAWYDMAHGACRRIRISKEKDLFEAVDGLMQAVPYSDTTDAMAAYLAQYPNDQYTDLYFVTGEVSMSGLNTLSAVKTNYRQIIHVSDHEKLPTTQTLTAELERLSQEMGINMWPVNIMNVKNDMEQLRLS